MKSITNTFEKISDSLNPIVVKEVRQAVQGKFLVVVLMLFLVVQLFAMGISLAVMRVFSASGITFSTFSAGRTIFTVLLGHSVGNLPPVRPRLYRHPVGK